MPPHTRRCQARDRHTAGLATGSRQLAAHVAARVWVPSGAGNATAVTSS
jgi:hypothetical protein